MNNYKMLIAYDGRRYKGWRHEKNDNADKSVQGKLERLLSKLYNQSIEVISAVNTDAGVHALKQVANFKAPDNGMSEKEIFDYIQEYLTDDIVLISLEQVDDRFHSRLNKKKITYQYRLWKTDSKDALLFDRYQVYRLQEKLDVDAMRLGAEKLIGKHNFSAFTNRGKNKNTIKELFDVNVDETENEIQINITGNDFLVNMERFIVGTLIQIGLGQKKASTIDEALTSFDKEKVGHKAMAHSLCLTDIKYI